MRIRLIQRSSRLAIRRCTFLSCQKSPSGSCQPISSSSHRRQPFACAFFSWHCFCQLFSSNAWRAAVSLSSLLMVGTFLLPCWIICSASEWKVRAVISSEARRSRIRSSISCAAWRPNASSSICSAAASPRASSQPARATSTEVLPLPAPASTSRERSPFTTARACDGLSGEDSTPSKKPRYCSSIASVKAWLWA